MSELAAAPRAKSTRPKNFILLLFGFLPLAAAVGPPLAFAPILSAIEPRLRLSKCRADSER